MGATSVVQGSLFPPRDDENPLYWVMKDPWEWRSYFYKHGNDVFTDVYTHEEGPPRRMVVVYS